MESVADLLKSENQIIEGLLHLAAAKRSSIRNADGRALEGLTHSIEEQLAELEKLQKRNRALIQGRRGLAGVAERAGAELSLREIVEAEAERIRGAIPDKSDARALHEAAQRIEQLKHIAASYRANLEKLKAAVEENRKTLEHTVELIHNTVRELQHSDNTYSERGYRSGAEPPAQRDHHTGIFLTTDA